MLGDLTKYEDFVVEVNETKRLQGGKLPQRIYTVIIMEPEAINLKELEQLKRGEPKKPPKDAPIAEKKDVAN